MPIPLLIRLPIALQLLLGINVNALYSPLNFAISFPKEKKNMSKPLSSFAFQLKVSNCLILGQAQRIGGHLLVVLRSNSGSMQGSAGKIELENRFEGNSISRFSILLNTLLLSDVCGIECNRSWILYTSCVLNQPQKKYTCNNFFFVEDDYV